MQGGGGISGGLSGLCILEANTSPAKASQGLVLCMHQNTVSAVFSDRVTVLATSFKVLLSKNGDL